MATLRFDNKLKAIDYVNKTFAEKIGSEFIRLLKISVDLSIFKSHRNYETAYYVDLDVLDLCLQESSKIKKEQGVLN